MATEKIRALNDAFRTTMTGGKVLLTAGVDALPSDMQAIVIRRVATFSDFTKDNDPHGEHDFGSFEAAGRKFFWKIDYYDAAMQPDQNNPRPHDHARQRVLIASPAVRGAFST